MDFSFGPEQRDIQATVRNYLDEAMPGGPAAGVSSAHGETERWWKQLSRELGLTALLVPERFGGLGLSTVEIAIVGEELGRHVLPFPFLSTAAQGAATLSAVTDEHVQARWLPAIAAGELRVALALQEDPKAYRCIRPSTVARRYGDLFRVTGVKHFVLDAADAELILVLADLDGTPALFAIDRPAAGVEVRPADSLDATLRLASVRFTEAPATLIKGACLPAIARGLDVLVLAQAAISLGGAERCLQMAVEYAKSRFQFGRPIGGFQAIKHKCADIYVALEVARTAVWHAAWALAADLEQAATALPAAAAVSAHAYSLAAAENIQIHGGIGYTWEHPAHWYFKRARSLEVLHGTTQEHYRAFLAELQSARLTAVATASRP